MRDQSRDVVSGRSGKADGERRVAGGAWRALCASASPTSAAGAMAAQSLRGSGSLRRSTRDGASVMVVSAAILRRFRNDSCFDGFRTRPVELASSQSRSLGRRTDEMTDGRRLRPHMEASDFGMQLGVSPGDTGMLALVLRPAFEQEPFGEAGGVGGSCIKPHWYAPSRRRSAERRSAARRKAVSLAGRSGIRSPPSPAAVAGTGAPPAAPARCRQA